MPPKRQVNAPAVAPVALPAVAVVGAPVPVTVAANAAPVQPPLVVAPLAPYRWKQERADIVFAEAERQGWGVATARTVLDELKKAVIPVEVAQVAALAAGVGVGGGAG